MSEQLSSSNKRIAKNAMYMYIRMLVIMLVSLYTTRVVLSTLGVDDYGIYNVVGGIVVFFSFINSGLAGAAKRFILAELAVGDIVSQRKVFSLTINAHLLVVSFVIIAAETIGLWLIYHVVNVPEGRMNAALLVYQASVITAVSGILQSPFSSVIIAFEKMSVYAYLSIIDIFLRLGIVFLVQIIDGDKLVWYAYLLFFVSLFDLSLYYIYCRHKFAMCQYVKVKDKDTFRSILSYVGWTVFGLGSNVLTRQGVNLLVNYFFTVAVNAAMGVSNTIVNAASQFVTNLQVAFAPQLAKNYLAKDYRTLLRLLSQSSRYTSYLILVILIPISFVISDLLVFWLGAYPKYTEEFCVLTLICVFIEAVSMPLTTIITAEKTIKNYQVYISGLYVMVFLSSWAVLLLGTLPYYVLVARAFIDFVMVGIRLRMVNNKVAGFSVLQWIKEIYGKAIIIVLFSLPLIVLFGFIQIDQSFLRLIVIGGISVLWVSGVICLFGLNNKERMFVKDKVKMAFCRMHI